jgi:hypothetical protein
MLIKKKQHEKMLISLVTRFKFFDLKDTSVFILFINMLKHHIYMKQPINYKKINMKPCKYPPC